MKNLIIIFSFMLLTPLVVFAQIPQIVSTTPAQNALSVAVDSDISVTFDIDMDAATINDSTFIVSAMSTGLHTGTITYDSPTKTATLNPADDFEEGEIATVVLTGGVESSGGTPLDNPYAWSFTAASAAASGAFALDSNYTVGVSPWSIFSADLDGDGDLDLATANAGSDNVSVLLNNGDGSFATQTTYGAGSGPYSIFLADLDGDGDLDLATANVGSDNVSVLLNEAVGFKYLPGDANMINGLWPPQVIGADVTFLVNYFRGTSAACLLDGFYCSADANGDCLVIGSDVTRMVTYFRGLADITPCPDYEPAWPTPDDLPAEAPSGWPNCETPPISSEMINGSSVK